MRERSINIYGVLFLSANKKIFMAHFYGRGSLPGDNSLAITNSLGAPGTNLIDRGSTTNSKIVLNFYCKFIKALLSQVTLLRERNFE